MEAQLPFFADLPADQRANIGLVVQAGLSAFSAWLERGDAGPEVPAGVFYMAPRELARAVSLQHTVDMVRLAVDIVEERVVALAEPDSVHWLREAVLRYSRELAFAAAQVYAAAAETRGAWDARLEALVIDGLVRGSGPDGPLGDSLAVTGRRAGLAQYRTRCGDCRFGAGGRAGAASRGVAPRRPRAPAPTCSPGFTAPHSSR